MCMAVLIHTGNLISTHGKKKKVSITGSNIYLF